MEILLVNCLAHILEKMKTGRVWQNLVEGKRGGTKNEEVLISKLYEYKHMRVLFILA